MKKFSKEYVTTLIQNETAIQAAKYFVVGGLCTVLDFTILYVLTDIVGINYLISSIISFMSGTILNYFLCILWIFDIRRVEKAHHEFLYYLLITGIGLLINTALIWFITDIIEVHYMISKLMATFVTFWWNFWARKYFLHTIK